MEFARQDFPDVRMLQEQDMCLHLQSTIACQSCWIEIILWLRLMGGGGTWSTMCNGGPERDADTDCLAWAPWPSRYHYFVKQPQKTEPHCHCYSSWGWRSPIATVLSAAPLCNSQKPWQHIHALLVGRLCRPTEQLVFWRKSSRRDSQVVK